MRRWLMVACATCVLALVATAQTYKMDKDVRYTAKPDAYSQERLLLDVYYPEGAHDVPVVMWMHGGGLEAGNKSIPDGLKEKGWVVVSINYRLLPHVTVHETIDDAAEALSWVFKHAADYGGDPDKVVVTGHSAGGYLALMLCLNKSWLSAYGEDADRVFLCAPFSGQAITHFNVRKMQNIGPLRPTIDEWAPLYWVRGDCPPLLLICGDREQELYGRYDENQYLARMMKLVGHTQTYLYEIGGHDHNAMVGPAFHILEQHLRSMLKPSSPH